MEIFKSRFKDIQEILMKEPFTRGGDSFFFSDGVSVAIGAKTQVADDVLTNNTISQARYMAEYDPAKHDIHRDTNVPSIVAKVDNGSGMGYIELKYKRMALSYQKKIAEKQSLYLAAKPMALTLYNNKPNQETKDLFTSVKQDWISKNMDVRKYEAVYHQKCTGDSAMLFYFDSNGELQTKVYSYMNGYTIIPHTNSYGEIDFVAFSYTQDTKKMLDCYDNTQMYRFERVEGDEEWKLRLVRSHGFNEVPVAYKRGEVAWENAQSIIEVLEIIYNIYTVIMKRHGWGLLYIRGVIDPNLQKTAGAVILNDPNPDSNGTAEFKAPPTPEGMENLIKDLRKQIQWQTSTVFLHPEDIKLGSEPSGTAIKMLLNAALEKALLDCMEWDNVADKMCRLFLYGLGVEKGNLTSYNLLKVRASFEAWMPQSDTEIVSNIAQLRGAKVISVETASEYSPFAEPDEYERIKKEKLEEEDSNNEIN